MGTGGQIRTAWRGLLPAFLLLVLLLRGFAVPGYMVGEGANGATALVPCQAVQPAHHGSDGKRDPARHSESPCPFAALAAPALPPAPPLFAVREAAPEALDLVLAAVAAPRPLPASPPPPSTGPPAFPA